MEKILLKQDFEDNYILKDHSITHLKTLGFHKISNMCDEDNTFYSYRFPVYKYLGKPTLECDIKVKTESGEIRVDVYDMDYDSLPAFYSKDNVYNSLIKDVDKKIISEFKKLGIERK